MSCLVSSPVPLFPLLDAIPEAARLRRPADGLRHVIRGEVREWKGPFREVFSPVHAGDGDLKPVSLGRTPLMGEREALDALDAAAAAYDGGAGGWPTASVGERIRRVEAFVERFLPCREEVARLLMWEIGKTLPDSLREFDRTVAYIRDTVEALKEADRAAGRFALEQGWAAQIRRSPLGVVLCMGPFNYPLNETFTTLIPALIMGNTAVFKPPKLGVLLYAPILSALAESFPPGVVNTVFGDGGAVVGPIVKSGAVDVLAFIGSAKVGSLLKHQHPRPNRLRCVLGLEAKNPGVVLPDADLDLAVQECVAGAFSFNGQRCTAIKIIFVHRSVADDFVARLAAAVEGLRAGMPWEEGVTITPLPEEGKAAWLSGLVESAKGGGARVVNRGGGVSDRTLYFPTVLYPARPEMEIAKVEQFGPVLPVVSYGDEEEVVRWAKAGPWGQQASLFGTDPARLSRFIDPFVNIFCRVNVNARCERGPDVFPFTGRKDSAEGTLSVTDALRVFSIRSLVAAKATPGNEAILSRIVTERRSKFLSTDFLF